MNSFTEENYLKAIYKLLEKESVVYTSDIASRIKTKAASVTDMLRKLAKKKLINYQKYNGVTLTPSGQKIALGIIRKHRLWEMFLAKTLDFKWDEVHEVAEQLEHIQSEKLISHIDKFLKYPKFDPHGDPIPDTNGKFVLQKTKSFPLSEAKQNVLCVMTGVIDHSISFLQMLDKSRLVMGCKIKVKDIQPYDKSLAILMNEKKHLFVSNEIAKNILVTYGNSRKKNIG